MKPQKIKHIRSTLLPCILLSAITGTATGALIFAFKISATKVAAFSNALYSPVRQKPIYLLVLILGAIAVGLLSALVLRFAKDCRGGGIPNAIASIRGLLPFKWLQGIFALFFSSMLTYLVGVPLGSEGPSVQMGTAVGKGAANLLSKREYAWDRHIMTGGACAGFATALGAPLTGILFAVEEANRRFSAMIFTSASVAVVLGMVTQELLAHAFDIDFTLFEFSFELSLPLSLLWVSILIGGVCGVFAILFTKTYLSVRKLNTVKLKKLPIYIKFSLIFAVVALLGFFSTDFIGSGHELIEKIMRRESVWFLLIAALLVRSTLMIFANNVGITGGMFFPILAFGAIVAALIAEFFCGLGVIDAQYYGILVAIGMVSFLAAASHTPITALAFSLEVLCGVGNILPVGVGVVIAYLIVEVSHLSSFTDTVMEAKIEQAHEGKNAIVVDTKWTVQPDAFAIGQEARDILWPPTCTVLSIEKSKTAINIDDPTLGEGDLIHLHYQTYDPEHTLQILSHILGDQTEAPKTKTWRGRRRHQVPID